MDEHFFVLHLWFHFWSHCCNKAITIYPKLFIYTFRSTTDVPLLANCYCNLLELLPASASGKAKTIIVNLHGRMGLSDICKRSFFSVCLSVIIFSRQRNTLTSIRHMHRLWCTFPSLCLI